MGKNHLLIVLVMIMLFGNACTTISLNRINNDNQFAFLLGKYSEALSYYEKELEQKKKHNQYIGGTLNMIALIYSRLGQYDKSISYYKEALQISRQANNLDDTATILNNTCIDFASLGRYDEALSSCAESLKTRKEHGSSALVIAKNLKDIGMVYSSFGQYDQALYYFGESLKINKEISSSVGISKTLNNMGYVYLSKGDYKKAESYFKEVEKEGTKNAWVKEFGKEWMKRENTSGLVDVYIATGRSDYALKLLADDIAPNWYTSDTDRIKFHTQRGLALKRNKNFKESSDEFLSAVSLIEDIRDKVKQDKTGFMGAGYFGGRMRSYRGLVSALSERWLGGDTTGDDKFAPYGTNTASSAFYFSESTKARTLIELMAQSAKKSRHLEIPEALRKKEEDTFNQLLAAEYQWDEAYKQGEEGFKELVKRKDALKKELDSIIAGLRKDFPVYAALNYPKPIPAEQLPLKKNEILLEYAITEDATYLFRVKNGGAEKIIKIPKGKEEIEAVINDFMSPLHSPETKEKFSIALARKLYNLLLDEALKDVPADKKIIIIPDGILGLLPFEALVINEGKDIKDSIYVGDKYSITYSQSATALALTRMLKPSQATKPLFALGNPVFAKEDPRYIAFKKGQQPVLLSQNTNNYAYRGITLRPKEIKISNDKADIKWEDAVYLPLLETETEVKDIAKLFNIKPEFPDILLSITANETSLKKVRLKDYRYLHFATHADLPGKVQGINEPFLLLGQVENEKQDDGFLTLSEVLGLSLDADMAVLSACVTGKGKIMEGEGVANLARAFQHAGSRSVVVSLWEVPSKETVEYMKKFYGYIKAGKNRGEALRLARNDIKSKYPNPFYWAVFILHGEG